MRRLVIAVLFAVSAIGPFAEAAVIDALTTLTLPAGSTGIVGPFGVTAAPNNDNDAAASPNVIGYNLFLNAPGLVESEFRLSNSGGTTEYRFTQTFVNNSGAPWFGFAFELGFGTGAAFTRATPGDALDFDAPGFDPPPTASQFPDLAVQPDVLLWSGAIVPSIGVVAFTFAIDVPDGLAAFHPNGLDRFTLRQIPLVAPIAVPEPSSALLVALAAASLCIADRARRRRSAATTMATLA